MAHCNNNKLIIKIELSVPHDNKNCSLSLCVILNVRLINNFLLVCVTLSLTSSGIVINNKQKQAHFLIYY